MGVYGIVTLSASKGRLFTIQKHITLAYKLAGLVHTSQAPTTDQLGVGKDLLETIVDALDTRGIRARSLTFWNLTPLVVGQAEYALDDDIFDLVDVAAYVPPGFDVNGSSAETTVRPMTRAEWQRAAAKGSNGLPTRYWCNKETRPATVTLYQPPSAAGAIRFQARRFLSDTDDLSATLDMPYFWNRYIQHQLAVDLCKVHSQSSVKQANLMMVVQEELPRCLAESQEMGEVYMEVEP